METPTIETTPSAQITKSCFRWRQCLIVLCIGLCGVLVGWQKAEQHYPADSKEDVQAIEITIRWLLEAAHADNMPRMVERDEYVTALDNISQATSKLLYYASNLNEPPPSGFSLVYTNYDMARDNFLIELAHLHTRDNRLKATLLYYDAAGWYPNPPTDEHDWRKLNQTIPWNLNNGEAAERVGYAVGYGGAIAVFAWLAIVFARWTWNFILARIRDVSQAARGR